MLHPQTAEVVPLQPTHAENVENRALNASASTGTVEIVSSAASTIAVQTPSPINSSFSAAPTTVFFPPSEQLHFASVPPASATTTIGSAAAELPYFPPVPIEPLPDVSAISAAKDEELDRVPVLGG